MRKLNFGCGSIQPEDWDNVDIDTEFFRGKDTDNIFGSTSNMEDNTYDIIVAHAVVQQFEWHNIVNELKELYRILKPGGIIRISLPDIERGFEEYKKGNIKFFPNGEEDINDRFSARLTWYSTSKSLLTKGAIKLKLNKAGFQLIRRVDFKKTTSICPESVELDTREHEFYFIEATK